MSKILVKGIILEGKPFLDWNYPPGPNDFQVKKTYETIDKFLRKNGQPIVPEMIDSLPFITSSVAVSCYVINNCLITNRCSTNTKRRVSIVHIMQGVSRLEDKLKMDETLDSLKCETWGFKPRWYTYWENYGDEKIINVPEKLRNIEELISYIPKLMKLGYHTLILPNIKE